MRLMSNCSSVALPTSLTTIGVVALLSAVVVAVPDCAVVEPLPLEAVPDEAPPAAPCVPPALPPPLPDWLFDDPPNSASGVCGFEGGVARGCVVVGTGLPRGPVPPLLAPAVAPVVPPVPPAP